jgi:hypothetical protein
MRVLALTLAQTGLDTIRPTPVIWPLARELSEMTLPSAGYPGGVSGLLVSVEEAALLRPTYLDFQEQRHGAWTLMLVPYRRPQSGPGDLEFAAYMRDATPFENDKGIIPSIWR